MVKKKRININVGKDGKVSIDVKNASGAECLAWTKEVEDALSSNEANKERQLKESYYQDASQQIVDGDS